MGKINNKTGNETKPMKVYVMTKAEPFKPKIYICVKRSKKEAEKHLRMLYPHMKKVESAYKYEGEGDSYVSDSSNTLLLFIDEVQI